MINYTTTVKMGIWNIRGKTGNSSVKTRGAGEHMRKIKKALFQENAAMCFCLKRGLSLLQWGYCLSGAVIFSDIFSGRIRSAAASIWVYLAVATPGFFADMWLEMKLFSGWQYRADAAVVLFIRWLLSGFISAAHPASSCISILHDYFFQALVR